jgi:hypothetical protein
MQRYSRRFGRRNWQKHRFRARANAPLGGGGACAIRGCGAAIHCLALPRWNRSRFADPGISKTSQELFDIDTMGLEPSWTKLVATCPAAPIPVAPTNTRAAITLPDSTSAPAP